MANQILPTLRGSSSTQATPEKDCHPSTYRAQCCLTRTRRRVANLVKINDDTITISQHHYWFKTNWQDSNLLHHPIYGINDIAFSPAMGVIDYSLLYLHDTHLSAAQTLGFQNLGLHEDSFLWSNKSSNKSDLVTDFSELEGTEFWVLSNVGRSWLRDYRSGRICQRRRKHK